jgi:hypothetical protein
MKKVTQVAALGVDMHDAQSNWMGEQTWECLSHIHPNSIAMLRRLQHFPSAEFYESKFNACDRRLPAAIRNTTQKEMAKTFFRITLTILNIIHFTIT